MAQETSDAKPWLPAPFSDYLGTEAHMKFRFGQQRTEEERPGLLDIIDNWLINGDAIEHCPTFESFLVTIIEITYTWSFGTDHSHVGDVALWPDLYGVWPDICQDGKQVEYFNGDLLGIPTYADYGFDPHDHPVCKREHFEEVLAQRRSRNAEATN